MVEGIQLAEFPRLDWYPDSYLADTAHLSLAESGAYQHLLWISWRVGPLPNDDKILARYARASAKEWQRIRSAVLAFWSLGPDNFWRQMRLEIERDKARSRSSKAATSARTRWLENNKTTDANASQEHMLGACSADATINHHPSTITPTTDVVGGTQTKGNGHERSGRQRKTRQRLPTDWQPTAAGEQFALECQCGPEELQKFADHHTAKGNVMADWDAAWRTWCRNAARYRAASNRGGNGNGGKGVVAALRLLKNSRAEGGFGGG